MSERTNYEGHLAVLEKDLKLVGVQIQGLIKAMRENLDVLEHPSRLNAEIIASQAIELRNKQIEYNEIMSKIAIAKRALGHPV